MSLFPKRWDVRILQYVNIRIGVGLNSGEAASPDTVYNKIGKKKQFNKGVHISE